MRYALTAEQIRRAEQAAVEAGIATMQVLMDRAGRALAAETVHRFPAGSIAVVCGPGNNGGDGWVASRLLSELGREVVVAALREPSRLSGEAAQAAQAAIAAGVRYVPVRCVEELERTINGADVVLDAVFGVGLHGTVREPYASYLNVIAGSGVKTLSADVPSGVDSDTGATCGVAVTADATVTFSALKPGLLIEPGASRAGRVVVADVGIPPAMLEQEAPLEVPGPDDLRDIVPWPRREDHKGSRGRVAIVAGSRALGGAAVLTTGGALRAGAGYVYVVVPSQLGDLVLSAWPSAIVRRVAEAGDGSIADPEEVLAATQDADAVVAGPGLTCAEGPRAVVQALLARTDRPLLLDADALNVLEGDTQALHGRTAPTVVTPHPGEAARLIGEPVERVVADQLSAAARIAGRNLTCVLKGPQTIVLTNGRSSIVRSGGPSLAKAGTGDVLSGIIGTLLAQRVPAHDASVLGAYLHGRAGQHGAHSLTEVSFTAADLSAFIPEAFAELASG